MSELAGLASAKAEQVCSTCRVECLLADRPHVDGNTLPVLVGKASLGSGPLAPRLSNMARPGLSWHPMLVLLRSIREEAGPDGTPSRVMTLRDTVTGEETRFDLSEPEEQQDPWMCLKLILLIVSPSWEISNMQAWHFLPAQHSAVYASSLVRGGGMLGARSPFALAIHISQTSCNCLPGCAVFHFHAAAAGVDAPPGH